MTHEEFQPRRCPIGLEHTSDICSAGYCDVCIKRRGEVLTARAEKAERERDELLSDLKCSFGNTNAALDDFRAAREANARLREALTPFVALADKHDAIYRKRGGNPDAFPDTHPSFDINADKRELPIGVWRAARAALSAAGGRT